MGGKSRKKGAVSNKLIKRIKSATGEKCQGGSCGRKKSKGKGLDRG